MHLIALAMFVAQTLFGGLPIDGIQCERTEGAVEHIHASLQIYDRGHQIAVPAQVGFPQNAECLYWLHTHSDSGVIHIEAPVKRAFTLGEFFDVWGQPLDRTQAASVHGRLSFWVNGKPYTRDPRAIVLKDTESIVIQNGPPFVKPKKPNFATL
jgi:hypothetical protein